MKLFILLVFITTSLLANVTINKVGFNVGLSNFHYKEYQNRGLSPSKNLISSELYTILDGLFDDKSYKLYAGCMYSYNNDLSNYSLLTGVNKYYQIDKFQPYIGAIVGYGSLKYKGSFVNADTTATSIIGGLQAGTGYPINNNLRVEIHSKLLLSGYQADISGAKVITHNFSTSVLLGLSYTFDTTHSPVQTKKIVTPETAIENVSKKKVVTPKVTVQKKIVISEVNTARDTDNDGVLDINDKCNNTASLFQVDKTGCPVKMVLNIEFDYKSVAINETYDQDIGILYSYLKKHQDKKIVVSGHTDSVGGNTYNRLLSLERAISFKNILVSIGIDSKRIVTLGYGEEQPLSKDSSKNYLNRRIEVEFFDADEKENCASIEGIFQAGKTASPISMILAIKYDADSLTIPQSYNKDILMVSSYLKNFKNSRISVVGYSDRKEVSLNRAVHLKNKLVKLGVNPEQIEVSWHKDKYHICKELEINFNSRKGK